jgi:hypothetical protein
MTTESLASGKRGLYVWFDDETTETNKNSLSFFSEIKNGKKDERNMMAAIGIITINNLFFP